MNTLDSEVSAEGRKKVEAAEREEFPEDMSDITRRAREEYGRYFGVCGSYHHLKACLCKYCSAYPGNKGMFCARGGIVTGEEKKEGCLCETCELFKKFRFEDNCFCQIKKTEDTPERSHTHPDICTDFESSVGTIRICVLGEENIEPK